MTSAQFLVLQDIAAGYVPGPDQFRSILRALRTSGMITKTGTVALDMGAGPEVRVDTFALTLDGRAALEVVA